MRAFRFVAAAGLLLLVLTVVAVAAGAPPGSFARAPAGESIVGDQGQIDMLESDQQMLSRMRVSVSPGMNTMIEDDPMWVDSGMIRLQEVYQAQLDRMIAKRPGTP